MELSAVQLFVIGAIATVLVAGVNGIAKYFGKKLGRGWLSVIVYVAAGGLAYVWSAPIFPPLPGYDGNPSAFVIALLSFLSDVMTVLGPIVAFATLIYNVLLKQVLDKLGEAIKKKLPSRG